MLQKKPWTYIITKVNNTSPKGIITFTVKQDKYEPLHDYVQLDANALDYGDMYADYYASDSLPQHNDEHIQQNKYHIVIESPNYHIKLGVFKILNAKIYDSENVDITHTFVNSKCIWDFKLDNANLNRSKLLAIDEDYSVQKGNEFKCKFKFDGDEQYLEHNIAVSCKIDNLFAEVILDVIAL